MIYKTTSVRQIIEKLYRDYGHQQQLEEWDLIEWAAEALEFIGVGSQYSKYYQLMKIKSHRAILPCNFHSLLGLSLNGAPVQLDDATMGVSSSGDSTENSLNSFPVDAAHFPQATLSEILVGGTKYVIENGFLISGAETTEILMAYKGIALDDEGFPLVPDNVYYREAVTLYCQHRIDNQDWRAGRIGERIYRDTERKWEKFTIGAANQAKMPNIDKMENIKNQWIRLKPQINRYDNFFQDLSTREMNRLR